MNMYIDGDKNRCSGCGACANVCAFNAISMREDEYGFLYPCVDESRCISCKRCSNVCQSTQERKLHTPIEAYAATHKDKDVLLKSSSGGVFSALAEYVLSQSGAVCGCVYDENLMPLHICTENADGVSSMRKSKYTQSDVGFVYQDVLHRLKKGQLVLFTGTPCQVAALYSVVGDRYTNLITADLICHGVPSRSIYKQFLQYLEQKYNTKIVQFDFRSKKYKWQRYTAEFQNGKGKTVNIGKANEFYFPAFTGGNILRPNCFHCSFACSDRVSDITMGDFWGHEALDLKCDKENGISVFTVNTEAALSLVDALSEKLILDKIDYKVAVAGNTCLNHPTKKGEKWEAYMLAAKNNEVSKLAYAYRAKNKKKILRGTIKLLLPLAILHYKNRKKYRK